MAGNFLLMLANVMLWMFILGLHVARDRLLAAGPDEGDEGARQLQRD